MSRNKPPKPKQTTPNITRNSLRNNPTKKKPHVGSPDPILGEEGSSKSKNANTKAGAKKGRKKTKKTSETTGLQQHAKHLAQPNAKQGVAEKEIETVVTPNELVVDQEAIAPMKLKSTVNLAVVETPKNNGIADQHHEQVSTKKYACTHPSCTTCY